MKLLQLGIFGIVSLLSYGAMVFFHHWHIRKMIGDCGLTMQQINGKIKTEIGYHMRKD